MHLREESYSAAGHQLSEWSYLSEVVVVKDKEVEVHIEVGNCCVSQHELRSTERIQRSKSVQYGSDHKINARERSYHSPLGH